MILKKNDNFELEICVKSRGGRSARCMGTPPVAEMLASEARHARASGRVVSSAFKDPTNSLSRAPIERVMRDLATPSNESIFGYLFERAFD